MTHVTYHRQQRVTVGSQTGMIDEGIVELLELIWRAGWVTRRSCEAYSHNGEGPHLVWVEFDGVRDAEAFLTAVAGPSKSLYLHAHPGYPTTGLSWRYNLGPEFTGPVYRDDGFHFSLSVRFPTTDLPAVIDALREHLGE